MKKSLYILPLLVFITSNVWGQQIPLPGTIRATDHLWNPAFAASVGQWGAHATYNQQWLGFDGAPVTGIVGGHMSFDDNRMGLAGDIIYDATGPLTFVGVSVAYKYQINPAILGDHDRLSFGILGSIGQRRFDATRSKVSDSVDPLLSGETASTMDFNAGAGIMYRTVPDNRLYKSHFFIGAGASRLLPYNLSFNDASPYGNRLHGNAVLGWRSANALYLDHTLWFNYADASLYNLGYQFRVENPDVFWAGLNLNTNFSFGLETGMILDGSWLNAEQFRIGALALYNIRPNGSNQGFSLGINFELVKEF